MKLICTLVIVIFLNFVINVDADTLVLETNNISPNSILIDVKVKDSTRNNNIYEGIISYDNAKISNFTIVQDNGWEIYTKNVDNGIEFIVFNMNDVAVNDTVLFMLNMNYKDIVNVGINEVNTANGIDGISLSNVNYSYKYEIYIPPVVDNNPSPIIPEDVTNNIEPEIKDEIVVPDTEEIEEEVDIEEEHYDVVVEQDNAPWWVSILVIVFVVTIGVCFGRDKVMPRGDK